MVCTPTLKMFQKKMIHSSEQNILAVNENETHTH